MRFIILTFVILSAFMLMPPTAQAETLRVSMSGPEMLTLDEDAASVIVGNPAHVTVALDNPRSLMIMPKAPGMTNVIVLGRNGNVLFNEAVIVGGPSQDYIRIQNACINGGDTCQQFQTYYCEEGERCQNVGVMTPASSGGSQGASGGVVGASPAGTAVAPPAFDPSMSEE